MKRTGKAATELREPNKRIPVEIKLFVPTLHECVEGARGRQVRGDGHVLLGRALRLDADGAIGVGSVAAHPARRVCDVGQTAVTVVPEETI